MIVEYEFNYLVEFYILIHYIGMNRNGKYAITHNIWLDNR